MELTTTEILKMVFYIEEEKEKRMLSHLVLQYLQDCF